MVGISVVSRLLLIEKRRKISLETPIHREADATRTKKENFV